MARRCLEVKKLKIYFWQTKDREEKVNFTFEAMSEFLKKYASNTNFSIRSKKTVDFDTNPGIIVTIEFSKRISVITIIHFLKKFNSNRYSSIVIKEKESLIEVNI